jgi:hypothetical protein
MASGVIHGVRRGLLFGSGGGAPADCTPPFAGINAFAAIKRPGAANQFPCIGAGWVEPQYYFGCQNTSGNLTDTVGGLVFTAIGAVGYSGTVTDYNGTGGDKWVTTTEAASQGFYVDKDLALGSQLGWNIATQSVYVMGCSYASTVSAERIMFVLAGKTAESMYWAMTAGGLPKVYCGTTANATGATNYKNATATPFWWGLAWNRTVGRMRLHIKKVGSAAETITPGTWANKADGGKGINVDVGGLPPVGGHNWIAAWTGADAETMDARGTANLTDLGV